jgi:hypothetical protein
MYSTRNHIPVRRRRARPRIGKEKRRILNMKAVSSFLEGKETRKLMWSR